MFAAVIVETRPLPDLKDILDRHMKYLPKRTDLIIFHGKKNAIAVREASKKYHNCTFHNLLQDELSSSEYNSLLTSTYFWDKLITYERVLIFQSDSALLRKGIEDFMYWDYVGAPWSDPSHQHGGNGGLSLRNPKVMLDVIKTRPYNESIHGNEDYYFCDLIKFREWIGKLAPREICSRFSCEAIYKLGTLGTHAIEKYLTLEQLNNIKTQYDETTK